MTTKTIKHKPKLSVIPIKCAKVVKMYGIGMVVCLTLSCLRILRLASFQALLSGALSPQVVIAYNSCLFAGPVFLIMSIIIAIKPIKRPITPMIVDALSIFLLFLAVSFLLVNGSISPLTFTQNGIWFFARIAMIISVVCSMIYLFIWRKGYLVWYKQQHNKISQSAKSKRKTKIKEYKDDLL